MIIWNVFITFILIGFVSFGGGYAIIPIIHQEALKHQWITTQKFSDIIAISGMSPGPIATNSAILVGFNTDGIVGALAAFFGITIPSIFLVIIVATSFKKINHNQFVKSFFYGLRPIVTSLVFYSALTFAYSNQLFTLTISWYTVSLIVIFLCSLIALIKYQISPLLVILVSGLFGILLY